jgi:hypothetical protein
MYNTCIFLILSEFISGTISVKHGIPFMLMSHRQQTPKNEITNKSRETHVSLPLTLFDAIVHAPHHLVQQHKLDEHQPGARVGHGLYQEEENIRE